MSTRLLRFVVGLSVLLFLATSSLSPAAAADKTALDLLPPTTVAYLEVPQPAKVLGVLLDHPLAKAVEQQPAYQKALAGREYQQFRAVLKLVEDKLGMDWRKAAESLASGGLHIGLDLPTQGVVGLLESADETQAKQARDSVLAVARAIAAEGNQADPVKEDELRGVTTHQIGNVHFAVLGKWLVASNKPLLINMVLENHLGSGVSLGSDQQFQAVRRERRGQPAAWLYGDLRVLRLTGALRAAASKKSDNPLVELIAGGIVGVLPDASHVTASLELDASHLLLTATLPGKLQTVAKPREFYFGPDLNGAAPPLLQPQGTLLSLSAYRDFASFWRHAPDLFDDRINAKLAEAESNLATFFGGRNFRDEILGNLEPGVQLVVARQQFPQGGVTPAIKLPAVALVLKMKKPAETKRTFKITFQSVIGFFNIIGGMKGVPPLDINSEKLADALVVSTEYLPPDKAEIRSEAPLQHNASPTAVFWQDRFILSTARPLAMELLEQVQHEATPAMPSNATLILNESTVHAALSDNLGPLVARNMLDRGHDRAAAEKEIDSLLQALANVERSWLRLSADSGQVELAAEVVFTTAK